MHVVEGGGDVDGACHQLGRARGAARGLLREHLLLGRDSQVRLANEHEARVILA